MHLKLRKIAKAIAIINPKTGIIILMLQLQSSALEEQAIAHPQRQTIAICFKPQYTVLN
ncbi:hypothetical protein H6G80_19475 [Nostoc sp. FACHB-87]|uniref:hypothetical protein n=1 Tax=Nostocaceae TaxID=1162 RepID=UPI0016833CD7|nr:MULTISPECIES: hypothetical protein [Nostocaceae]MBD2303447.1 hypothetical protein [Nostoc sp. FACHB-190]MBD2456245.1 hypothetical protein [Nostoc sp. FACHB-87]MBD2477666.1 hypothetical protein [Anabaena sp. FACHB-83]